ncbi:hypothetical protein [Enterobacter ludwigii]|uniref:hypothetical protein n=1 Tax=Enterobacter ludwigii TaxID=299767 RepID=UPI002FD3A14A
MENKSQFLTVETICIKYSIKLENIIELWCDNNIPLYIHLEGNPCQLSCSIRKDDESHLKEVLNDIPTEIGSPNSSLDNIEQHKYFIEDRKVEIINEVDLYQKDKSPLTKIRQFRMKKGAGIFYIPIGDDQFYYDGYAYGYWRIKPGPTTRFIKGDYKISNSNPLLSDDDVSALLKVIGHDEGDFLIFKEAIEVNKRELCMNVDDIENLEFALTGSSKIEKKESENRYSKVEHLALCILLNEYCLENDGSVNFTTMAGVLTSLNKNKYGGEYEFKPETIRRWLKNIPK